jgi:FkbM family methyltransferase
MSWGSKVVRSAVHDLGSFLRGEPTNRARRDDPFIAQQHLLGGQQVGTIFDVGANRGQTAREYHRRFPEATIHSFEPFPDSYRQLTAACAGLKRVVPRPLAVCDRPGTRRFFCNERSTMNSVLPFDRQAHKFINPEKTATDKTIDVEGVTLDNFCASEKIDHLDILKMDIQGGELLALRGASGLFEAQAIDLVFTEVLFAPMYAEQGFFHELCGWLHARGYQLFGIYQQRFGPHQFLGWANAIFCSPRLTRKLTASSP